MNSDTPVNDEQETQKPPLTAIEILNRYGYYTAAQFAKMVGMSVGTIRLASHRGTIHADRTVRNVLIFHEREIAKYRSRQTLTKSEC